MIPPKPLPPTRTIPLSNGMVAIVDAEDYAKLAQHTWTANTRARTVYALRGEMRQGRPCTIHMHREILGLQLGDPHEADHINGNGLDNRKENLRIATRAQNARHQTLRPLPSSGFRGVNRQRNVWRARIAVNGRRLCLGTFKTPEEAAAAYDTAAREHHGEFAATNAGKQETEQSDGFIRRAYL
jgi:hypothetical protein